MAEAPLLCTVEDGVAVVTFNRPARLNAMDPAMGVLFDDTMARLGSDLEVRVVVLTGAGRGFCAGADLTEAQGRGEGEPKPTQPPPGAPHPVYDVLTSAPVELRSRFLSPAAVPQPVIAAVNGPCAGIGLAWAVSSDVRLAAPEAVFIASFARRGLTAEAGIAWSLQQLVGAGAAADMLLSGRKVDALEALRIGLVSEVAKVPVLERALAYARDLAANTSPRSLRVIKRQLQQARHQTQADALRLSYLEVVESMACEDFKEGMAAFVEGRPPRFTGR